MYHELGNTNKCQGNYNRKEEFFQKWNNCQVRGIKNMQAVEHIEHMDN